MSSYAALTLVDGDGDEDEMSRRSTLLVREIRARLAEVDTTAPGPLVVGVWKPWDGLCVIALAGEADMSNAAEIAQALEGHLGSGPCQLVVELSLLTFMDSTGINQLVTVARPLKARGGDIVFVAPSSNVARVFEIVKLGEFAAVVDSLEAALGGVPLARSPGSPAP